MPPTPVSVQEQKDVGSASAPVLIVIFRHLARLCRQGRPRLGHQLLERLIEVHHRPLRIRGLSVQVQDMLHLCDKVRIKGRNAPHLLLPGLEGFLLEPAPHGLHGERFQLGQCHQAIGQKLQCPAASPFWRLRAGHRNQQRLLSGRELPLPARSRILLERLLQAFFHPFSLRPVYCRCSNRKRLSDLSVAVLTTVGHQEDVRPLYLACRRLALPGQLLKHALFVSGKLYQISYVHRTSWVLPGSRDHI